MNTISSTLGLFALKSYVSVLPEMEKETALKIVGGDWFGDELDCFCEEMGYPDGFDDEAGQCAGDPIQSGPEDCGCDLNGDGYNEDKDCDGYPG